MASSLFRVAWDIRFPYGVIDIVVDTFYLVLGAINFGKSGGDIDPPEADVTGNGVVDVHDLSYVAVHYGPYTL
jgi:hypothetical protein